MQRCSDKLQTTREEVLKLETAVCGLRNSPLDRNWVGSAPVGSVYLHVHECYSACWTHWSLRGRLLGGWMR